jgi:hypothetical protein
MAAMVLATFHISETEKFWGIGPVVIKIPSGARYFLLWVKREGSIKPTASYMIWYFVDGILRERYS